MNYSYIIVFVGILIVYGCSPRISQSFLTDKNKVIIEENYPKREDINCNNHLNYIPDTIFPQRTPKRYVKVNVHFINSKDSFVNFNVDEGIQYAKDMIYNANAALHNNQKMNLPIGNNTPVYAANLEWILAPDPDIPGDEGVYFHYDDSLWIFNYKNQAGTVFNSTQFDKYGIQKGKVLNIFVMDHHPDSIASPVYNAADVGVGTAHWAKIAGNFHKQKEVYWMDGDKPIYKGAWYFGKILDHELLHSMGLAHAWGYDGCDDTPVHPNCWNYTGTPPCDKEVSNNMMDYNDCSCALTPCQISKVHYNLSNPSSNQNEKLKKVWCESDPNMDIIIYGDEHEVWQTRKNLQGNITINNGGTLEIHCSVSLPNDAKIIVKPGATLIVDGGNIYNDCDGKWQGIEVHKNKRSQGTVIFRNGGKISDVVYEIE